MKQALYGKDISPKCAYCAIGKTSDYSKEILCTKMGIMQPDSSCKRFKYDPLKRMPKTVKVKSDFSKEEFAL